MARSSFTLRVTASVVLLLGGCAAYHVGTASLYPPDIHTVYVPMFESESFRRNMGEQLTEAVCKEIEKRTPFKVVGTPNADSVLTGRILSDKKNPLVREPFNEPREIEMGLVVKVSWADRRGAVVREGQVPVPPEMVGLVQTDNLIPEVGQSTATSLQKAMQRMAQQIVDLMEAPW